MCHICNKELRKDRVSVHDHTNGSYRGAAYSDCNLNDKNPSFIPVTIHNLIEKSKYTSLPGIKDFYNRLNKPTSLVRITSMQRKYGTRLDVKQRQVTHGCTTKGMF